MRSFSTWGKTNLASVCGIYYCSEGASNSAQYGAACVIQRLTNTEQVPASPENPPWYSLFWYGFGYFGKRLEKQEHSETKTPQFTLKRRKSRTLSCSGLVGEGGFAYLRKSHGGCECPPDTRQEPPFESIFTNTHTNKKRYPFG